jgi:la-related protein 1
MDSRGWISIPLISSFNRVRQLTVDPSLVREVLVLSTVVEVKDDWVRMSGWEQFVLPHAMRSEVEGLDSEEFERSGLTDWRKVDEEVKVAAKEVEGEIEEGDEEEEEEDVVFVMERESRSWSPERRQV